MKEKHYEMQQGMLTLKELTLFHSSLRGMCYIGTVKVILTKTGRNTTRPLLHLKHFLWSLLSLLNEVKNKTAAFPTAHNGNS